MTHQEMMDLAWSNVERNLGCCVEDGATEGDVYNEAYTLAFDALADKGVSHATARSVAVQVAQRFAQP
jgi:hypothetical protein